MVNNLGSSVVSNVPDLLTQSGIVDALALVRNSVLTNHEKRNLRDLIFTYANSNGDQSLQNLIIERLAVIAVSSKVSPEVAKDAIIDAPQATVALELTPVAVLANQDLTPNNTPVVPKYKSPVFSNGRQTPIFNAPSSPAVTAPSVKIPVKVSVEDIAVEEKKVETTSTTTDSTEVLPTLSVDEIKEEAVANISPTDPNPELATEPVAKSIVDEVLAAVAPNSEPTVEFKPPYQEGMGLAQSRARIAEIKQTINTKVGNPVALVELNREAGNAYMTSLLEAMKAVSGGGGDVSSAMEKLETAASQVLALLDKHVPQPLESVKSAVETSVQTPVTSLPVVDNVKTDETVWEAASRTPVESVVVPISPMMVAESRFKNVAPVTEAEPLKTPLDLPTAADKKAELGITDPLHDPDVDSGLEQLLGEWSLFRKSGVFGTGPKGSQHPLFMKLASLEMPILLSGRFEGSTPEIRQSITDYMNGWRYEQGIIYEQDETFEHYLRRVIRHIIDSQTRRRSA